MNTTESLAAKVLVDSSTPEFVAFLARAQKVCWGYTALHFPKLDTLERSVLTVSEGARYLKVARETQVRATGERVSCSSHCFVDRSTGDVLKADSWTRPAKGARGNIFDAQNGAGRMGPYGTEYNR